MSTANRADSTADKRSEMGLVRSFNKHVLNPAMMLVAGRRHWYAAVIRHTGRRSGRAYATPVVADRVADGFIVPLPYGTQIDWLRNVLTAGHATIQVRGETYAVTAPRVIDADAALPHVPAAHARVWRRLGITNFLRVTIARDQP